MQHVRTGLAVDVKCQLRSITRRSQRDDICTQSGRHPGTIRHSASRAPCPEGRPLPLTPSTQLVRQSMKRFLGFAIFSGIGWVCDLLTFTILVKGVGIPAFWGNLASSFVGITFVWMTSLKSVFRIESRSRGRFLLVYWAYQLASILFYSKTLSFLSIGLAGSSTLMAYGDHGFISIVVKVILTPVNLLTNFVFMKLLTKRMSVQRNEKC